MNAAQTYASALLARLGTIASSQQDAIDAAAEAIAEAIGNGHRVWIAETTRSFGTAYKCPAFAPPISNAWQITGTLGWESAPRNRRPEQ